MNARIILSGWLIGLGVIIAVLPDKKNHINQLKPSELLKKTVKNDYMISVDNVARSLVTEDSIMLLIDLRTPKEFKECRIPGSINIPYETLLEKDFSEYLNQEKIHTVFYSNGEILAAQAWTLCTGIGYKNNYIIQGGLNEWYKTIMNSSFSGKRISARENTLFETRVKARRLFIEMNSLPDSLKINFKAIKRKTAKKLDGGCG